MQAAIRSVLPVIVVVVVLVALGVAACTAAGPSGGIQLDRIKLPPGFSISLYADGVPNARSLTLGAAGTVFVGTRREGKVFAVLDRNLSPGRGGIFAEELRAGLFDVPPDDRPVVFGYVLGLGGRDVTPETIDEVIERTRAAERPEREDIWVGVKA